MEYLKQIFKDFLAVVCVTVFLVGVSIASINPFISAGIIKDSTKVVFNYLSIIYLILGIGILITTISLRKIYKNTNYYRIFAYLFGIKSLGQFFLVFFSTNLGQSFEMNFIIYAFYFIAILNFFEIYYINRLLSEDDIKINIKRIVLGVIIFFILVVLLTLDALEDVSRQGRMYMVIISVNAALYILACIIIVTKNKKLNADSIYRGLFPYLIYKIIAFLIVININLDSIQDTGIEMYFLNIFDAYYMLIFIAKGYILNEQTKLFQNIKVKNEELKKQDEYIKNINNKIARVFKKYNDVLESSPDGIIIVKNNKINYVNSKFMTFFDLYSTDDISKIELDELFVDEGRETIKTMLEEIKKKRYVDSIELKARFNDKTIYVEVSGSNIVFEDEIIQVFFFRDLSLNKFLEDQDKVLQQKIKEDRMKEDFLTNISHDFKIPVNVIYSALQLQEMCIKKENFDEIEKYYEIVKSNSKRLIKFIKDLIDISQLDNGYVNPNFVTVNIVDFVEFITMSIVPYVEAKNITVTFDTEDEEIYASLDKELMERVILNMLSNAIKYNKDFGEIMVNIYVEGDEVKISIKDSGIGIPADKFDLLFERYRRVQEDIKKEGSGVGLSIVKSIVELHKGSLSVNSEEGIGSEFIISLPMINSENEENAFDLDGNSKNRLESLEIDFSDIL